MRIPISISLGLGIKICKIDFCFMLGRICLLDIHDYLTGKRYVYKEWK